MVATFNEVFEALRATAEADTANYTGTKRRPSWGPAIVLGAEIEKALADLNTPLPEKPVARLWATFAGRDRVTSYLRDNLSTLPLTGTQVRGFELHLGQDRAGLQLLRAKHGSDAWGVQVGIPYHFPHSWELYRMNEACKETRQRVEVLNGTISGARPWRHGGEELARAQLPGAEAELAEYQAIVTELNAERDDYKRRLDTLTELIKRRVAEFGGSPRAEMIAGARVTGNCAICGRGLTDPLSLERGIGPECFSHIAPDLRAYLGVAA
jgi:hypothetical protein